MSETYSAELAKLVRSIDTVSTNSDSQLILTFKRGTLKKVLDLVGPYFHDKAENACYPGIGNAQCEYMRSPGGFCNG
jgi:hypothetical protein